MSFLKDAVSNAEQQIKTNLQGQANSLKQNVKGAIQNTKNTAVSSVVGAVNNTVKAASGAVIGAAGSLLTGDVSGALGQLANAPSNILNSALSGLGGFAGELGLSAPGTGGALSGNGGIDPGNSLAGALSRPDPMLSFYWYAQLPVITLPSTSIATSINTNGLGGALLGGVTSSLTNGLSSALGGSVSVQNSAQLPWYFVEEATLPFRQFTVKSIFREGRERHYPDKYSVDNLRLSIYADTKNMAFTYLQAWNNTILSPFSASTASTNAGGWGRPADYKKPIFFYLLDPVNNVLATIEYTECWITSLDAYNQDSNSSTRTVNHVSFSVGDVFINLVDVSQEVSNSVQNNPSNNLLTNAIGGVGSTLINAAGNAFERGVSTIAPAIGSAVNGWFN